MFIPATTEEIKKLGWDGVDVILVTGDSYVDSSFIGVALIGKVLLNAGYKVVIIPQPDINSERDIMRFGEPRLFWGVTAGATDSMVANYTALMKKRNEDDMTAGGRNGKRPDRATITYTNLIRKYCKGTKPIVLGGVEASLRRISHYDYWSDSVRRSILFDAKADIIVYGMGEKAVVELAAAFKAGSDFKEIKGICYAEDFLKQGHIEIPEHESVVKDNDLFVEMFKLFYNNNDPKTAVGLAQKQDTRYLIQNPPQPVMTPEELDKIYGLSFEREAHPMHAREGKVKALETIKFSITSHRGCFGDCNFCAISVHQGAEVISRSEASILNEVKSLTRLKGFNGNISDIGGPTANMYGASCRKMLSSGKCRKKKCVYPKICGSLDFGHSRQIDLLKAVKNVPGVRRVFISSGLRYDMIIDDRNFGVEYMEELVKNHVSGQLKIAPEHVSEGTLGLMGKTGPKYLREFKRRWDDLNKKMGKNQFLTYYLMAAHPGCSMKEMEELKKFASQELKAKPEQVQVFTPTPSTWSSLMYHTMMDPFTEGKIFVEKGLKGKRDQFEVFAGQGSEERERHGGGDRHGGGHSGERGERHGHGGGRHGGERHSGNGGQGERRPEGQGRPNEHRHEGKRRDRNERGRRRFFNRDRNRDRNRDGNRGPSSNTPNDANKPK